MASYQSSNLVMVRDTEVQSEDNRTTNVIAGSGGALGLVIHAHVDSTLYGRGWRFDARFRVERLEDNDPRSLSANITICPFIKGKNFAVRREHRSFTESDCGIGGYQCIDPSGKGCITLPIPDTIACKIYSNKC